MELGQVEGRWPKPCGREHGYAMAALLVGLSIMAVLMTAALPVWSHQMKREREEELIWRGQQYARAIGLFQRKYANTFPPTIDILIEQRFLRKKYKDPITNSDFQPIPAGGAPAQGGVPPPPSTGLGPAGGAQRQGGAPPTGFNIQTRVDDGRTNTGGAFGQVQGPSIGIQGVVSKSKDSSIKIYNGRTKYNERAFVYLATSQRVGAQTGQQQPGVQPGRFPGMQPGAMPGGPGGPGGFGPQAPPAGGRPPVPFPPPGSGFQTPGQPPNGPASPFAPPPPTGRPPAGVRPPGV
jgi:type II secretory pathway pseudopilin PulG